MLNALLKLCQWFRLLARSKKSLSLTICSPEKRFCVPFLPNVLTEDVMFAWSLRSTCLSLPRKVYSCCTCVTFSPRCYSSLTLKYLCLFLCSAGSSISLSILSFQTDLKKHIRLFYLFRNKIIILRYVFQSTSRPTSYLHARTLLWVITV